MTRPLRAIQEKKKNFSFQEMEKAAANVAKASAMITALTKDSKSPIPKAQLAMKFDFLLKQVHDAKEVLERVSKEQIEEAEKIKRKAELLDDELMVNPRTDPRAADYLERQRHGRYIVWHLLRCGFVATARKVIQEMDLGELIDIEIFEAIHDVEKGLIKDKSTVLALAWIERHRSKLRRIGSRLEIVIRQLDVVEMIGKGMVMEAILYVKQFMTPIAKANHSEDLQMVRTGLDTKTCFLLFPDNVRDRLHPRRVHRPLSTPSRNRSIRDGR